MLNLSNAPPEVLKDDNPQVGDIYRKGGGTPGFWWIITVQQNAVIAIAFDSGGNITGAQRYVRTYFAERDYRRVGYASVPQVEPEW